MLLLIGGYFEKEIVNLFEQLLFRYEGEISVLVFHLRLSGKSLHKVLLSPGPGMLFLHSFACPLFHFIIRTNSCLHYIL